MEASHLAEIKIAKTLQAGHALTVRWDCGGDESFVYTQIDGQELEADYGDESDLSYLLDLYLTDRLELPSAGEFSMEGTGRIFIEAGEAIIDYKSEALTDNSWLEDMSDEDLAEMSTEELAEVNPAQPESASSDDEEPEGYLLNRGMSDHYTGRVVLFQL